MAIILSIDTSTSVGSVALSVNGEVVINRVSFEERTHAIKTGVFVDEVLKEAEEKGWKPEAVAVCSGPGSYTGLRIGVSLAKGLCYGFEIPLIAVDALTLMASGVSKKHDLPKDAILMPMIDARRMEVYMAAFDCNLNRKKETVAEILEDGSFKEYENSAVYLFGSGSDKCRELNLGTNVNIIDNIHPLAEDLAILAEDDFNKQIFVDVAYFEPFYLKNFVVTKSKKNVLGI